ncbi:MAG: HlyD family efflux transporter periplasmic adaptor subunit [Verrucomicrobiota bacterium]|nr:HlyD family efflux transporter periplasmic adaptor subunit [Verrucomicrobiota bacterium]
MRVMTLRYWRIACAIFVVAFIYWWIVWKDIAWTDDCYVHGNPVPLTPLRSGFVTAIHTDDTYLVMQNEVLVELDQTDSLIALDEAKEELAETVRRVCEMYHQVFVYHSEIEVAKAEFIRNAQDFEHRLRVLNSQAVSLENYEHSVAALRSAFFDLKRIESLYDKAFAQVQGVSIYEHPLIKKAADRVRYSWVHLHRCNLYAPTDGIAAERSIQVGMWVPEGTPLMTVVPMDQIWFNANFKETQLTRMRIGQRAIVRVDLYGDSVRYHGRVVGLPSVAGNVTGLLPPQNLSGNWIKIVQRLPVRIEIDPEELKAHPLRLGLSSEATVFLDDPGTYLPTSTKGSPTYSTTTYVREELGDAEFIDQIIACNIDPVLEPYFTAALDLPKMELNIPRLIQEALPTIPAAPLQPPLPENY